MKKLQKMLSYSLALLLTFSSSHLVFAQDDMGQTVSVASNENTQTPDSPITRTNNSIIVSELGILNSTTNLIVANATITADSLTFDVVMPENSSTPVRLGDLRLSVINGTEMDLSFTQIELGTLPFDARLLDNGMLQIAVSFDTPINLSDLLFVTLTNMPLDLTDARDLDFDTFISVQINTSDHQSLQYLIDANLTGVANAGRSLANMSIQNRRDEFESDAEFVNSEAFMWNMSSAMRESIRDINESVTSGSTTLTILSALSTTDLPMNESVSVQTMFTFSIQDDNITWNAENPWLNAVTFTTDTNDFTDNAQGVFVNTDTNTAYFRANAWSNNATMSANDALVNIQIQDLASNRIDTTTELDVNFYDILMAHTPTFGSRFESKANRGGSRWGSNDIDALLEEMVLSTTEDFEPFMVELKEDELNILLYEGIYLSNMALVDNFLTLQVRYTNPDIWGSRDVRATESRLDFFVPWDASSEALRAMPLFGNNFSDEAADWDTAPLYQNTLFFVDDAIALKDTLTASVSTSAFETVVSANVSANFASPVVPSSISFSTENMSYPFELDGISLEVTRLTLSPNSLSVEVRPNAELTANTNFEENTRRDSNMLDFFDIRLLDENGNPLPFSPDLTNFFDNEWQTGFSFNTGVFHDPSATLDFMSVATIIINNLEINVSDLGYSSNGRPATVTAVTVPR